MKWNIKVIRHYGQLFSVVNNHAIPPNNDLKKNLNNPVAKNATKRSMQLQNKQMNTTDCEVPQTDPLYKNHKAPKNN